MSHTDTLRELALASDFEAVCVFATFAKRIGEIAPVSRDALFANLPGDLRSVDGTDVIPELETKAEEPLSPGASVRTARLLLVLALDDPGTATLVDESFEAWRDDRQFVETVLAVGLVGAVWITLASTTVTYKNGVLEWEKSSNTPMQLHAFADVIRAMRGLPRLPAAPQAQARIIEHTTPELPPGDRV